MNRTYENIIFVYALMGYEDKEQLSINPRLAQRTIENLFKREDLRDCGSSLITQIIDFKKVLSPELRQESFVGIVQYLADHYAEDYGLLKSEKALFNQVRQKIRDWRGVLSYDPKCAALAPIYKKLIKREDYNSIKAIRKSSGENLEEILFIREYAKKLKSNVWRPGYIYEGCLNELAKSFGYPHPDILLQEKYEKLLRRDAMEIIQELYHETKVFPSQKLLEKIGRKTVTRKPESYS